MSIPLIIIEGIVCTASIPRQTSNNWQMDIVVQASTGSVVENAGKMLEFQNFIKKYNSKDAFYKLSLFKKQKSDFPEPSFLLDKSIKAECKLYGKQYTVSQRQTYSLSLVIKHYSFQD